MNKYWSYKELLRSEWLEYFYQSISLGPFPMFA